MYDNARRSEDYQFNAMGNFISCVVNSNLKTNSDILTVLERRFLGNAGSFCQRCVVTIDQETVYHFFWQCHHGCSTPFNKIVHEKTSACTRFWNGTMSVSR